MNKFGLLDEGDEQEQTSAATIHQKLAAFAPVRAKAAIDVAASDAAAAQHGFTSREPGLNGPFATQDNVPAPLGRRRRAIPSEPTRHLAIRLTSSGYDRFVAYADRQKLTYHDALIRLMDGAGE